MADRYEAWKRFCEETDKKVKEFKDEKGCPFCGGHGEAHWNYNGDYDPKFWIECDSCGCRVRSDASMDDAIEMWNRRVKE